MAETPPVAPVKTVVDHYHGREIADPYRYMEDFESPQVQAWVKQQAEFAEKTLHGLPGRDALLARITELEAGAPFTLSGITRRPNGDLFYFKQRASENVAKVYFRSAETGEEKLLIDPETLPGQEAGEHITIGFYRICPVGRYLLYGLAASGSEETSLKIFDIAAGRNLPDTIDRIEAEYALPSWLPNGKSFAYSRRRKLAADAPPTAGYKFTQAFLRTLGDDAKNDRLLFANGLAGSPAMQEMDFPAVILPRNSRWAIGQIRHGDETDVTLYAALQKELGKESPPWKRICGRGDQVTDFAVHENDIYLLTAHAAPRFKVVRTSLDQPDFAKAKVIVPAGDDVVDSLAAAQEALYVGIFEGVRQKIVRIPYDDQESVLPISLPAGEPSAAVSAASEDVAGVLIGTQSWTREGRLYAYHSQNQTLVDTGLLPEGKYDAPANIASTEVLVASHDGEKIPLSIIHRQDLQRNGSNPTLVTGYGAYGHTATMRYNPASLAWLEQGGVLAIAHVRGGGVFGKAWHHAGRRHTKPNTWKDFIACGEYLVKEGYTSPAKLAGSGGSAGGILIGRAITERPDLFAAAQIAVGCTDMLRFETTMNGPPNVPEFGSVSQRNEFEDLLAMSTFHHIKEGVKYPAVILTHGINDPRVEPWLSAKTTARLQAASASGKPVLFRVDYHAGHGIGSTKKQRQQERADVWSFLLWQLGQAEFQPRE